MKKVFALLIVLAIMCTLTVTAFAEDTKSQKITLTIPDYSTLSKVAATVTLPTVGANPDYDNVDIDDFETYFTGKDLQIYVYDDEGRRFYVQPAQQFIEGRTYRIEVLGYIKPEYRIDENTTEFTINGIKAKLSNITNNMI